MKSVIFVVLFSFLMGSAFCQTPLNKEQEKQVKAINREAERKHREILKHPSLTFDEKKSRIELSRSERDAELARVLTADQVAAVKANDAVNWDRVYSSIERQEGSRLRGERDQKLRAVNEEMRALDDQQNEIKRQMDDLKNRQKNLKDQQKSLKMQRKDINAAYK